MKNQLEGIPERVVKVMLQRQVEQGNPEDRTVFEKNIFAMDYEGGFEWDDTPEKYDNWKAILIGHDFDLFNRLHPELLESEKSLMEVFNEKMEKANDQELTRFCFEYSEKTYLCLWGKAKWSDPEELVKL